jgi:hypothetical protein
MFVSCTMFVLSGRGLCDGPITRPEESHRLWCVSECDQVDIKTLYSYCEQVGRRGKDYETKRNETIERHGVFPSAGGHIRLATARQFLTSSSANRSFAASPTGLT